MSNAVERTDVLVIGSGFGGAITAYHLAAGGAKVTILERGPSTTTSWAPPTPGPSTSRSGTG
jgi:choline dehydrogenase-like flavoprotein